MPRTDKKRFVVCIENAEHPVSLEKRKIYVAIPDPESEGRGLLRVIDESGEDYLYPKDLFVPIELPQSLKDAVLAA